MTREYRLRQDRSRKGGHAHARNIQDYPAQRLSTAERAADVLRDCDCPVTATIVDEHAAHIAARWEVQL